MSCNHKDSNNTNQRQEDNQVSIQAVDNDDLVSYSRHKLEDGEESSRKNTRQMHDDADILNALEVVVAFTGEGTADCGFRVAEDAFDVEEHESGEGESEQGAAKDDEQDEVVALGEADGVVYTADECHEGVGRWSCYDNHLMMCACL